MCGLWLIMPLIIQLYNRLFLEGMIFPMLESFRKNKQETINVILYSGQQSDTWSDQYFLNYQ